MLKTICRVGLLFACIQSLWAFENFPHSQARLLSKQLSLSVDSKHLRLAFDVKLEPEWHSYWVNPGDSGAAPIFDIQLDGATLQKTEVLYPTPKRIDMAPLTSFAYEGRVAYLVDLYFEDLKSSELKIRANVEWLVCRVECVPALGNFSLALAVGQKEEAAAKFFSDAEALLPGQQIQETSFELKNEGIFLKLPKSQQAADLFPLAGQGLDNARPRIQNGTAQIQNESESVGESLRFLMLGKNGKGYWVEAHRDRNESWFFLALLAFFGGLLLNFMPCVLPVLSLKTFSLLKSAEESAKRIRIEAVFYSLGALSSFLVVAAILLALRFSGEAIGWGFQLQSPIFVFAMALFFFVLSFNFLDLYQINLPFLNLGSSLTQGEGRAASFYTGVLSVLVASPCTAPFMGVALGAALALDPFSSLMIFFFLGLGFAFPFLLLAIWPPLIRVLPKPGNWMNTLKKILFVPMIVSSIWLFWVGYRLIQPESGVPQSALSWEKYSRSELERNLNLGHPVFVNFTADWCLSCKVNEALVFESDRVVQALENRQIKLLKADWTQKDAQISEELARYKRASVPLYLYFPPGEVSPRILPELLTPQLFLQKIDLE